MSAKGGPIQVLRFEGRPSLDTLLVRHIEGRTRPDEARPVSDPIVLFEADGEAAGRERLALYEYQRRRSRTRGRRPHEAVDVVVAGPPPYGSEGEWDRGKEERWARASVDWVRSVLGPESVIVAAAALHRDENSPHLHLMAVPVVDGKVGWCAVRDAAVRRPGMPKKGKKYSRLQDAYWSAVGRQFGLGRGEIGSTAKHRTIDRQRSSERAAELARAAAVRTVDAAGVEARRIQAAAVEARALVDGDERLALSHGIVISRRAKQGRAEREALEAERDSALEAAAADRARADAARGEAAEAGEEARKAVEAADQYRAAAGRAERVARNATEHLQAERDLSFRLGVQKGREHGAGLLRRFVLRLIHGLRASGSGVARAVLHAPHGTTGKKIGDALRAVQYGWPVPGEEVERPADPPAKSPVKAPGSRPGLHVVPGGRRGGPER